MRVAQVSGFIGCCIGLDLPEKHLLKHAALLHDIGKIKVPTKVLNKVDALTTPERELIRSHPKEGGRIIRERLPADDIVAGIESHHEHYDGNGYPYGMKGEAISVFARIISIADAFDAMVSPRPYREGTSPLKLAMDEIQRFAGAQFDPYIVRMVAKQNPTTLCYGLYSYRQQCLG